MGLARFMLPAAWRSKTETIPHILLRFFHAASKLSEMSRFRLLSLDIKTELLTDLSEIRTVRST